MRIWHEELIPHLCRPHLLSLWREGLGAYSIITNHKKGYSNHPAVKEFEKCPMHLIERLAYVREEMLSRGYKPKPMPDFKGEMFDWLDEEKFYKPWQTLEEQIEVLRNKKCDCQLKIKSK